MRTIRQIYVLVIFAVILSACRGQAVSPSPSPPTSTNDALRSTLIFKSTSQPALGTLPPTNIFVPETPQPINSGPSLGQVPTPAPDPLRFVFPTPGPAPVSAWRPPLYTVPWSPTPFDHFYFVSPIAADVVNWPLADYRYGGVFFADVVHTGVDIPAPKGTPVLAAGPGKIIWAGYGVYRGGNDPSDPYGLAVTIRHDFGYQDQALYTVYGHLDQVDVVEGQHVETGDLLGLVGETGKVTGPHLHFEVRLGSNDYYTTRNPELWLVPPIGWGILAGRVLGSDGILLAGQLFTIHSLASDGNWFARTYGNNTANSDPYYRENLVVGDLPAGIYEIRTAYVGLSFITQIVIRPGVVSYFTFHGRFDFEVGLPPTPGLGFNQSPEKTPTHTP